MNNDKEIIAILESVLELKMKYNGGDTQGISIVLPVKEANILFDAIQIKKLVAPSN